MGRVLILTAFSGLKAQIRFRVGSSKADQRSSATVPKPINRFNTEVCTVCGRMSGSCTTMVNNISSDRTSLEAKAGMVRKPVESETRGHSRAAKWCRLLL